MSTEQNKELFRRFIEEFWNRADISVADELVAPEFVEHEEVMPGTSADREGLKLIRAAFHSAFPDLQATIEDMIAEGDRVMARITWTGTQRGEFMGIPPSGKGIAIGGIDVVRMVGGKTVEHWGQMDSMRAMQQLGAIPAAGERAG